MSLHALKKLMASGEKLPDPEFDAARQDYLNLHHQTQNLKSAVERYAAHIRGLLEGANSVATTFGDIIASGEAAPGGTGLGKDVAPIVNQVLDMKKSRLSATSDNALGAVLAIVEGEVLNKVEKILESDSQLLDRIVGRQKLKEEYDYYTNKVKKLADERAERAAKGKVEKPKDVEQYERNEAKAHELQLNFNAVNTTLLNDLRDRWNNRAKTFGELVQEFIAAETQVVQVYATAVKDQSNGQKFMAGAQGMMNSAQDQANAAYSQLQHRLSNSSPHPIASGAAILPAAATESFARMQAQALTSSTQSSANSMNASPASPPGGLMEASAPSASPEASPNPFEVDGSPF